MVRVFDRSKKVEADVIILGCSLPGIVTAHKLKSRFGNTMDIVVLDLVSSNIKRVSKCGVIFQEFDNTEENEECDDEEQGEEEEDETKLEEHRKKKQKINQQEVVPNEEKLIDMVNEVDDEKRELKRNDIDKVRANMLDGMKIFMKHKTEHYKSEDIIKDGGQQDQIQDQDQDDEKSNENETSQKIIDNVARFFLQKFAREFKLPLPVDIIAPVKSPLTKVFQNLNGETIECRSDFHDFDHLSFFEKFELNQYQTRLDNEMRDLFQTRQNTEAERNRLLYYDRTSMETDICGSLFFSTSREIMRMAVRIVCGASADTVSLLFYLHQCFRTSSSRNHLDGDNTRIREKLLGYCRKRLANKLQQSIADITMQVKLIKEIRTCKDAKVILETRKGGTIFVCDLLAMALKPDELDCIEVGEELLSRDEAAVTKGMIPGHTKKFLIRYNENVWGQQGYSGDIISIRGPIIWAMEMPELSATGKERGVGERAALVGILKILDINQENCKQAVVEQLVKLFGEGAAKPYSYIETDISDVYIPRCGDYVALRTLTGSSKYLEWGAFDIFADGDVVAALEAGHSAYISLLRSLRPQAQTYDDVVASAFTTVLGKEAYKDCLSHFNYINGMRWSCYLAATYIAVKLLFKCVRKE